MQLKHIKFSLPYLYILAFSFFVLIFLIRVYLCLPLTES